MSRRSDFYGGRRPRDLPLYSLREAARIVRIPPATLRSWVIGRPYPTRSGTQSWPPLVRIADPAARRLSFTNLVELHVLSVLRGRRGVRVRNIRKALRFIQEQMGTEHPLADVDTSTDEIDVYVEFFGQLWNASQAQRVLRPSLDRYLKRIERDERGLARRLFPIVRTGEHPGPRLVVIDPERRFGRPVLDRAGIETSIVAERFRAGESVRQLAEDFTIEPEAIEEALRFEELLRAV